MWVYGVAVDGTDVTERVLWDRVAYGPEGDGPARFRWTRPAGMLLVPVDRQHGDTPIRLGLRVAAETTKPVESTWAGGSGARVEPEPVDLEIEVPAERAAGRRAQQRRQHGVPRRLRGRPGLPGAGPGPVPAAGGGVRLLRGRSASAPRGAPPGRGVRRRLLPLLRGHRLVVAAAGFRLADPLPAGGGGPLHPLGLLGRVVAAVRVPHRPQPAKPC